MHRIEHEPGGSALEVFRAALRLGLTSFGGPIAHLGYFREEYVERRRWLDEGLFAELVALCQSLPGPASSQLGIAIGTRRAGPLGGLAAWLGFTLPSVIAMTIVGSLALQGDISASGWVHGLKLAAVAVVAQAAWAMARTLTPDWPRRGIALAAGLVALLWTSAFSQVAIIVGGAVVGLLFLRPPAADRVAPEVVSIDRRLGLAAFGLFIGLLVALPVARAATGSPAVAQADAYYRTGALVFGGGHVVLPLLHSTVVAPGWVTESEFLAGYGAAQAVPGPLFTLAAYLGTVASIPPGGPLGAALAVGSIFLPSFLLVWTALAFWDDLRRSVWFRRALLGTNAAVVGLLATALYTPVWTGSVVAPADVVIVGLALAALARLRVAPIVVVAGAAVVAQVVASAA